MSRTNESALQQDIMAWIKQNQYVYLATVDKNKARVRPVVLFIYDDRFFVTTFTGDSKVSQIQNNKKQTTGNGKSKWVRLETNKRYRTPEKAKPTKLDSCWLNSVDNSNRFDVLSVHEDQPNVEESEKPVKPPQIFVDRVESIQPLVKLLTNTTPDKFEIKVLKYCFPIVSESKPTRPKAFRWL